MLGWKEAGLGRSDSVKNYFGAPRSKISKLELVLLDANSRVLQNLHPFLNPNSTLNMYIHMSFMTQGMNKSDLPLLIVLW